MPHCNIHRFDTATFREVAWHISFHAKNGSYEGAHEELRRRGSPTRNLIGRALDFFALHDANERVRLKVQEGIAGADMDENESGECCFLL